MGTSRSTAELVGKMNGVAKAITGTNREAVTAAAGAFKASALAAGASDSGGDLRLSRWGRNGLKLGVGYDVDGVGPVVSATVTPRPMGPWKVLEYGADPHIIAAGLTRRQGQALGLFAALAGNDNYDIGELTTIARGNRNNKNSRRRRGRAQALTIGGNFRPYARHPGTRPKNTWSTGWQAGTRPAAAAYQRIEFGAIAKVIG